MSGCVEINAVNGKALFTTLTSKYPCKLVTPKSYQPMHQAVYILGYGGGIVETDFIDLKVTVGDKCSLEFLTQGSTKVFKRLNPENLAIQCVEAKVGNEAFLISLPEPITLFKDAAFKQTQTFYLKDSSSLILLDWFTSGRCSRGESFQFAMYISQIVVYINDTVVLRDSLNLQDNLTIGYSMAETFKPYACFCNLFLFGPRVSKIMSLLNELSEQERIYKTKIPLDIIWSVAVLVQTVKPLYPPMVLRIAGVDTMTIRKFLLKVIEPIESESSLLFRRV